MQQEINVNLNQTQEVTCSECNSKLFTEACFIRHLSGLLSPTGKPSYIPIPVFVCKNCNHVNEEFLPKM